MSAAIIRPRELYEKMAAGQTLALVDVRTAHEFASGHVLGAVSIPLHQITPEAVRAARPHDAVGPTYVICHSGSRSQHACRRLSDAGIRDVVNVEGGTAAWKAAGLPMAPRTDAPHAGLPAWVRTLGLLLVLACFILSWQVQPWFAFVGLAIWMLMIVGGRGACPLGTCATPTPSRPDERP